MSGGSHNYLFCADITSERRDDIARMAVRLRELGHHDAALRTSEVLAALDVIDELQRELSDVWHAVEWVDSCDWGRGDEAKAVESWRQKASVPARRASIAALVDTIEAKATELRAALARDAEGGGR